MSKFQLLALGARFEFEGECYVKVGPLTAATEGSGKQRMIPRSAVVRPLDGGAAKAAAPPPSRPIEREALIVALERFRACWQAAAREGLVAVDAVTAAESELRRELLG